MTTSQKFKSFVVVVQFGLSSASISQTTLTCTSLLTHPPTPHPSSSAHLSQRWLCSTCIHSSSPPLPLHISKNSPQVHVSGGLRQTIKVFQILCNGMSKSTVTLIIFCPGFTARIIYQYLIYTIKTRQSRFHQKKTTATYTIVHYMRG